MQEDLTKLYSNRFNSDEKSRKNGIWEEICKFITRKLNKGKTWSHEAIVDVAAGYCDFINNLPCENTCRKYAFDFNSDVQKHANADVKTICDSVERIGEYFSDGSVTLFFMSNFLEHISKEMIRNLLHDEFKLLKIGGRLVILTPNIRYTGGKYWDFFDHITPLTEKAIIEEAETIGYTLESCIPKFLPFTTKSRLPQWKWIVSLYLKMMPISGFFFGEQSLIVLRK